jgi:hypothetical protein
MYSLRSYINDVSDNYLKRHLYGNGGSIRHLYGNRGSMYYLFPMTVLSKSRDQHEDRKLNKDITLHIYIYSCWHDCIFLHNIHQQNSILHYVHIHELNIVCRKHKDEPLYELSFTVYTTCALFVWLISHQPAVPFSQNKPAISNQSAVLFSQNKSAPAISHQPNEQADGCACS